MWVCPCATDHCGSFYIHMTSFITFDVSCAQRCPRLRFTFHHQLLEVLELVEASLRLTVLIACQLEQANMKYIVPWGGGGPIIGNITHP